MRISFPPFYNMIDILYGIIAFTAPITQLVGDCTGNVAH